MQTQPLPLCRGPVPSMAGPSQDAFLACADHVRPCHRTPGLRSTCILSLWPTLVTKRSLPPGHHGTEALTSPRGPSYITVSDVTRHLTPPDTERGRVVWASCSQCRPLSPVPWSPRLCSVPTRSSRDGAMSLHAGSRFWTRTRLSRVTTFLSVIRQNQERGASACRRRPPETVLVC